MTTVIWWRPADLPDQLYGDHGEGHIDVESAHVLDGTVRFKRGDRYWTVPLDLVAAVEQDP